MAKAFMQRIRSTRRRESIAGAAKAEIRAEMENRVKPALIKSMEYVVKDWDTDVGFQARTVVSQDFIAVYVYPTGENKDIFKFVDRGTKPHKIRPKTAKVLSFNTGYVPKTLAKPARTVVGGGVTTGPRVFAKEVDHPGSEGRGFTTQIAADIRPEFKKGIDAAFKRASRRSNGR